MVEVLSRWIDGGLGLNRALEGLDGHFGVDFQGEEVALVPGGRVGNAQCYSPVSLHGTLAARVEQLPNGDGSLTL